MSEISSSTQTKRRPPAAATSAAVFQCRVPTGSSSGASGRSATGNGGSRRSGAITWLASCIQAVAQTSSQPRASRRRPTVRSIPANRGFRRLCHSCQSICDASHFVHPSRDSKVPSTSRNNKGRPTATTVIYQFHASPPLPRDRAARGSKPHLMVVFYGRRMSVGGTVSTNPRAAAARSASAVASASACSWVSAMYSAR